MKSGDKGYQWRTVLAIIVFGVISLASYFIFLRFRADQILLSNIIPYSGLIFGFFMSALIVLLTLSRSRLISTTRKVTEEMAMFKLAVDNASSHIIITDTDGKIIFANQAAEKTTGYATSEIVGQNPRLWGGQMDKEFYEKMWHQIKVKRKSFKGVVRNRRKNGEIYTVVASISPIVDEKDQLIGFVGLEDDITARINAEEALRRNEERFRALVEKSSDVVSLISSDGEITYESPAVQKVLGFTREELVGTDAFAILHPDETEHFKSIFGELVSKPGESVSAQLRVKHKDGTWRWIEAVGTNALAVPGINAIIANFRDITEQKMSSAMLENSERRYRSLFENMLDGFAYCQMAYDEAGAPVDFTYLNVNQRFAELTGLQNVVGRKVTEVIPGIRESNSELFDIYGRVADTGKPEKFETYVEPLKIWFSISVYSYEKGYFVAVFSNITQQKKATESLRKRSRILEEEKAKNEAILSSIGDGVVLVDETGKILLLNTAGQRLLGWKPEEVVGKKYTDIWYVKDNLGSIVTTASRPVQMALSQKETISRGDYYYTRKDGGVFPVHITVSPVIRGDKLMGAVDVFRDISTEKAIDRAKSEFVSLASHQLRTPLSAVNWYIEMLLNGDVGPLDVNQKKYLEEVYGANRRMVELVNSLLNTSRIDLGTYSIEPESLQLTDVVKTTVSELRPQITFKKLNFSENYDQSLPIISADPKLVRIVVQNVLANAVKYTPEGGNVGLTIGLVKKGEKVDTREIEVDSILIKTTDTGYGIPERQKDKVFQKLFRADNAKEKETEGTGLGLYIVKAVLDSIGGKVWFNSVENSGTTFYVTFPLRGMPRKVGEKQLTASVPNTLFY